MFTDSEERAVAIVVKAYAKAYGEDIIGALMHSGAFREIDCSFIIDRKAVVNLADKIEQILKGINNDSG